MRIFVGNSLLLEDRVISEEHYDNEIKRREGRGWELKRHIYLWGSEGLIMAAKNPMPLDLIRTIFVGLAIYNHNYFESDFPGMAIRIPEQLIMIDGGGSGLKHYLGEAIKICKVLERYGIGCLVNPNKRPLSENIEYCTKKIKRLAGQKLNKIYL
ncbi:MAG: hypothetical protein N3D20_01280 [Candidatus Pacearchaeota archaeon]|nr:hypothetical protein [Candidatus Pacearchaeota archaeon]